MKYKIWSWFFKLPFMKGFGGIVLGRLAIFKSENNRRFLWEHEMIHQKQMNRLTVPGFYIVYILKWFYGLIKYRSFKKAYRQNSLEKEAYGDKD